jgi:hypothetical protein
MMRSDGGVAGKIGDWLVLATTDAFEAREQFEENVTDHILAVLKRGGSAQAPPDYPPRQRQGNLEDEALPCAEIRATQNFQIKFGRPVISALHPLP